MASIVYVSDRHMIEYHRLNGSKAMNFWRLSDKAFTSFTIGDLLFFLDRKERKGKEKGVIGYGKLSSIQSMSLQKMWDRYGTQNGYRTKADFKEAILRANKNKGIPKRLNCLSLQDVIFFQGPIFLSEFDLHIPYQLESFAYLTNGKKDITTDILRKAKTIGIDVWSSALNDTLSSDQFDQDLLIHEIADCIKPVYLPLTTRQRESLRGFVLPMNPLKQCIGIFYSLDRSRLSLYYPVFGLKKDLRQLVMSRIGQAQIIKTRIESNLNLTVTTYYYGDDLNPFQADIHAVGDNLYTSDSRITRTSLSENQG